MLKDTQDEAFRHARRDALIRAVFQQLVYHENYSFERAYVFLGDILGLGKTKLTKIVRSKDECSLSEYDLAKFVVILHRISNKARNGVPDVTRRVAVGRAEAPRTLMNL